MIRYKTEGMRVLGVVAMAIGLAAGIARATETENLNMQVLPAPGKVEIDGKFDDWDLSAGVLVCSDVENARDKFAVWFHTMHDADNLYLLARWNDETPVNNPGSSRGDYGWNGDGLQFRFVAHTGDAQRERVSHYTAWHDRDGIDVIDISYGRGFNEGAVRNAKEGGAQQAFLKIADGKGYAQEIALPWTFLTKDGAPVKPGDTAQITVEPNFTIGRSGRLSLKDIFKPDIVPNRVFTFMSSGDWGWASFEKQGNLKPRPVRLADGREFAVRMENGLPAVDWTGLIKVKELVGFVPIAFEMPEDGYISLNIRMADGSVARQLLSHAFYTAGRHEVKWDGLTTPNWRRPGEPVAAGEYTWDALWHKGVSLRLRGWAANSGNAPWDGPTGKENWGGDHGIPVTCASDGSKVYLGWSGAEAGKALLAVDLQGNVQWKNSRGGMAGAELVAVDGKTAYVQNWGGNLYRVETERGGYTEWKGRPTTDLHVKDLWGERGGMPNQANALFAHQGRLYVGFTDANLILALDGESGAIVQEYSVQAPSDFEARGKTLVAVSQGTTVLAVDMESGASKPLITGLKNARAIALDRDGNIYVGVREPDNQVLVFGPDGKALRAIGKKGGRPLLGKWDPSGMAFINGLTVDPEGKIWVAEADGYPKRFSVWQTSDGAFVKEFFGPATYGALGGNISPMDPDIIVGQGCEWRLDPKTGQANCLGVITRDGMENARFGTGSNGKLYLATAGNWAFNIGPVRFFERAGDADYRLRTMIYYLTAEDKELGMTGHGSQDGAAKTAVWADRNGDGQCQANEVTVYPGVHVFSGWYMSVTPDLTLHSGNNQFRVKSFTEAGAPVYDLANPVKMPAAGLGSADGRYVLQPGEYNADHSWFRCFDIATGKQVWTYPDNFVGVHGSHRAPPAEVGMIRGSYGPCGTARMPDPVGNIWVITTNIGEWHVLTERGFYLTHLFQGDGMKVQWPEAAVPGALLNNCPPGLGGEDFGGSITLGRDGKLYLQAGKTGFWNVEAAGLDSVKAITGATLVVNEEDLVLARRFREGYLQETAKIRRMAIRSTTPQFTGDLDKDFAGAEIISYKKQDDAAVRSSAAWDENYLYLAWDVVDRTPWINGAEAPEFMYTRGDTVDFQLGTDPNADPKRGGAVSGDLRLSIGKFQGKPTAVLYRPVAAEKNPKTFTSGVIRDGYTMDSVTVLGDARINVVTRPTGYTIQAAIPLKALGLAPAADLKLTGDFGVTHSNQAGQLTMLRTYWNNQATGIVNDEVFELKMEPSNWGEITFQ